MAELARIRNFCVIAHVDHGKTTLSDRLLETTGTVPLREMRDQMLDSMELEREHGITIKARAVRMGWRDHELNLIDTPGHVDFTYEVSRSLAACEGAVLLADASQGIEAQTLANAYLAVEQGLEVIPAINKIDLPNIDLDVVREELRTTLGFRDDEILLVSGKTGAGIEELLDAIIARVPPPQGDPEAPLRSLIFDSHYDAYKGVVAHVRVFDGALKTGDRIRLMATERESELLELGVFLPDARPIERLETEYDVDLIATSPSVEYRVITQKGAEVAIDNPAMLPDPGTILEIREPWMKVTIIVPTTHVGPIMELAQTKRASLADMSYVDPTRAMLKYDMPLSEVIVDFYDQLKSSSRGYASLDYEFAEYRVADLVRLDILVAGTLVDALSIITHRERAPQTGRVLVNKLRGLIPKQMFDVRIQAAIGGKVVASETVKAKRKDVLAKCYGGDITRKRKLLEKQKEGKKRMKMVGSVEIPQEAFLAVLRIGDET